jgi:hypothetical protein
MRHTTDICPAICFVTPSGQTKAEASPKKRSLMEIHVHVVSREATACSQRAKDGVPFKYSILWRLDKCNSSPSVQWSPVNPSAQPFGQIPVVWRQAALSRHWPHVWLQPMPYSPGKHAFRGKAENVNGVTVILCDIRY